ncbi:hypothetical protein QMZ92_16480 [Streptomyces sp. HNM0645]|uniref:hypothetical protein n=1 Tax=Streptomyces sp. HNM0645 TaxID=2782343 RepID=UPI0024B8190F|nr:hypothetical protein [Streptomyces sp. HNM0645]MDI9885932.1 hypothetical protein [Streptomyces sp. HNM0645]
MAAVTLPAAPERADHPSRRLVAAGVKRGSGPLIVEQPMSANGRAAHDAASYVRTRRAA